MYLGHTDLVTHHIKLNDDNPFKERHRRIPPAMVNAVRDHLRQMLDNGVIRPSESPCASPVVLVRKSNGKLRFCIDYRKLNSNTVKDSYALPRIEELIDHLLSSGYYQVEVEEQDKCKTAFTAGPLEFFEFKKMPFGLTKAPATFQRHMERCLEDIYMKECFVFLDDILVPSKTFDEQLLALEHTFLKLRRHGLKLNPPKCHLFRARVAYCGHVVSKDGVETDPN